MKKICRYFTKIEEEKKTERITENYSHRWDPNGSIFKTKNHLRGNVYQNRWTSLII